MFVDRVLIHRREIGSQGKQLSGAYGNKLEPRTSYIPYVSDASNIPYLPGFVVHLYGFFVARVLELDLQPGEIGDTARIISPAEHNHLCFADSVMNYGVTQKRQRIIILRSIDFDSQNNLTWIQPRLPGSLGIRIEEASACMKSNSKVSKRIVSIVTFETGSFLKSNRIRIRFLRCLT